MSENLKNGIAAYKANDKATARRLFANALREDPNSERAWQWMFNVANNDTERIKCLSEILRINPGNEKANGMLARLEGVTSTTIPADTRTPVGARKDDFHANKPGNKKNPLPLFVTIGVSLFGLAVFVISVIFGINMFRQYTCQSQTQTYLQELRPLINEFDDSTDLANSTPRLSLGAIIQDMQRIRREVSDLVPPDCARPAAELFYSGMGQIIDGYLAFTSNSSEDHVRKLISLGTNDASNALAQLGALAEGSPMTPTPHKIPTSTPFPTSTPTPLIPTPMPEGSSIILTDFSGDKWEIQVLGIETADSLQSETGLVEKAQGRFAILTLRVTNRGLSQTSFYGIGIFTIVDERGRLFDENPYALSLAQSFDEMFSCSDMNPDTTKTCKVVFDISRDSTLYILAPDILADPYQPSVVIRIPKDP